jgi:ADP-dependent NAD(P)H-hydrate dehydratase / NAD(P)H-hydrate epimerase
VRVLTAEAMREVDRAAIERLGVPGLVLMENAAIGVADAIGTSFPEAESALVVCGPGNNGGDGLAVARHLAVRGYAVEVWLATGGREPGGDAAAQLAVVRRMELPVHSLAPDADLAPLLAAAAASDLLVDALYGTGLARPLAGQAAALVEALAEVPRPRVAVDIASGLHGSRPDLYGPHLPADLTVTFGAPKVAHVLPPAADAMGDLVVADLGVPARLIDDLDEPGGRLYLSTAEDLAPLLPARPPDGHKGDFGHAVVLAGSPGKSGAAILASRAAVRAGAGLVTAAVPEPILQTVDLGSIESMTLPLPAAASGQIAAAAVDAALAFLAGKSSLALGPGLGQEPETAAAIRRLIAAAPLPLVLDADGVNAWAGRAGELGRILDGREAILTPHPGELGRLLGMPTADVQADRLAAARRAARLACAVVVLKGRRTLIAAPEGDVHVNPTGNVAMATGGTGDVLTGILAALLAQGLAALDAARLGVYLHGLAGDLAVEAAGPRGFAAGDLVEHLGAAFRRLA